MPVEQRVRAVLELHDHAVERLHRRLDLEQAQHDRLVGAEQLAGGDPVDERVADLAGRAGDGDVDGWLRHGLERYPAGCRSVRPESDRRVEEQLPAPRRARRCARPRRRRAAAVVGVGEAEQPAEPALHVGRGRRHAGAEAEHLHRPAPLAGTPRPRVGVGRVRRRRPTGPDAGERRAHARDALEQPPDHEPLGEHAGLRERGVDRRGTRCAATLAPSAAAAMTAPITCGAGAPWHVELERRAAPCSSSDPVARAVEAVQCRSGAGSAARSAARDSPSRARRAGAAAAARAARRRGRARCSATTAPSSTAP